MRIARDTSWYLGPESDVPRALPDTSRSRTPPSPIVDTDVSRPPRDEPAVRDTEEDNIAVRNKIKEDNDTEGNKRG